MTNSIDKQKAISEVQAIIDEITAELNAISTPAKKQIQNTVYVLGTKLTLQDDKIDDRYYAFVIKKSFWKNKMSLELRSANYISTKIDDYKNYTNKESLDIFNIESLIIIKHFLLSFSS